MSKLQRIREAAERKAREKAKKPEEQEKPEKPEEQEKPEKLVEKPKITYGKKPKKEE